MRVKYYALNWYPAREIVLKAIENRYNVDPSGSIILIQPFAPWKAHLFDLEKELNLSNQELKYAMYQDSNGSWRSEKSVKLSYYLNKNKYFYIFIVQCIPIEEHSFKNRLSLPEKW